MSAIASVVLVLHLLGMAAILSGYVSMRTGGRGMPVLVWGARAQLLTGLLLVVVAVLADWTLSHNKIGVKLIVALLVVCCAELAHARAKAGEPKPTVVHTAAGLTVLNVLVAVLWSS